MTMPLFTRSLATLAAMVLLVPGAAFAEDVRVMISAGFYGVYAELGPAFEKATGHRLITTRGPSMGDSPEAIPNRLERGETADVLILDGGMADELEKKGIARRGSKVVLALSQVGMVVRAGAKVPDISTVDAFKRRSSSREPPSPARLRPRRSSLRPRRRCCDSWRLRTPRR
jgi:molybdate transport system substrate-binding protein